MHGTSVGGHAAWVVLWCAVLLVIFAPLTMRLYNAER
jgi:ABC-2 type transport system permease protein